MGHFIPLVSRSSHILKHAELQSTRAKCGQVAKKRRSSLKNLTFPQPSSSEIRLEALIVFFRRRYKSLSDSNSLFRKYCGGLTFEHQIFGWIRKFSRPYSVTHQTSIQHPKIPIEVFDERAVRKQNQKIQQQ